MKGGGQKHPFTFLHFRPSEVLKAPAVQFLQEKNNYNTLWDILETYHKKHKFPQ